MKKVYFFSLFILSALFVSAQCTPDGSITQPGTIAPVASIDCIDQGLPYDDVIQFRNFDQVLFNGQTLSVDSMRVDSVNNLPCGIDWEMNKPGNKYVNSEQGCIRLTGTTHDSIGQYKLEIWASMDFGTGFIGPLNANNFNFLTFYIRLKDPNFGCPALDTNAYNHKTFCNSAHYSISASAANDTICTDGTTTLSANDVSGSGRYTYQWSPSTGLSCTDCANPTFTPSDTGSYSFSVTVTDTISEKSDNGNVSVYVKSCASVSSIDYTDLSIYPNPNNGQFFIDHAFENPSALQANMQSIDGRKVAFELVNSTSNRLQIDLKDASKGVYFLTLAEGEKLYRAKIVVR